MKGLAPIVFVGLASWAGFQPQTGAWPFLVAVVLFEFWLAQRVARLGSAPAEAGSEPYRFTDEEAALVGRYRFYFATPALAGECASALAVVGLASFVLVPWLTYKGIWAAAVAIGVNLFLVGRYRFYFATPALASECASALAVVGIASIVLVPWLTYKGVWAAAVAIGVNLFLVGRLTRSAAPTLWLRAAAGRGDRAAYRALEVHQSAWKKIHAGNTAEQGTSRAPG